MPWEVKKGFRIIRVANEELWVVTKVDQKLMSKWHQQIIKIGALGIQGCILRFCEFCFFISLWVGEKLAINRTNRKLWQIIYSNGFVWPGSARQAWC